MIEAHPHLLAGSKFELFTFACKIVGMIEPTDVAAYYAEKVRKLEKDNAFLRGSHEWKD